MLSNFDIFNTNKISFNPKVIDSKYADIEKLKKAIKEAVEAENKIREDLNSFVNIRKSLESIVGSLISTVPQDDIVELINPPAHRERYLKGEYSLNFSAHYMRIIKSKKIIKDYAVINNMYDVHNETSKWVHNNGGKPSVIANEFVSFDYSFKLLEKLYNIIKKIVVCSAPAPMFNVNRIPIGRYIIKQKLKKSKFGGESRVFIGESKDKVKAIIFEYKGSYQSTLANSGDAENENAMESKVRAGTYVADTSRDDFAKILKPEVVNDSSNYGGFFYAIYNLPGCDESLSESLEEWQEDKVYNLKRALIIGSGVTSILVRLKENGINHRNVCPENIFLNSEDWYARITNYAMIKLNDTLAKSMSESKTLAITDYGIEYFTKNPYMPKGMAEFFFNGTDSVEKNKEVLKNVNWELLDAFAIVKIISECFCFRGPEEALNKKLVPSAVKLFEAWVEVDKYTSNKFKKNYAADAALDLDTVEYLIKKALKECDNR